MERTRDAIVPIKMKLNPKRFVHFSLFGKKAKPYTPNQDLQLEKEAK